MPGSCGLPVKCNQWHAASMTGVCKYCLKSPLAPTNFGSRCCYYQHFGLVTQYGSLCHPAVCVDVKSSDEVFARRGFLVVTDANVGAAVPQRTAILVCAIVSQTRHDAYTLLQYTTSTTIQCNKHTHAHTHDHFATTIRVTLVSISS